MHNVLSLFCECTYGWELNKYQAGTNKHQLSFLESYQKSTSKHPTLPHALTCSHLAVCLGKASSLPTESVCSRYPLAFVARLNRLNLLEKPNGRGSRRGHLLKHIENRGNQQLCRQGRMRGYDCENATTYSRSQAALQHLHEYSLILRALRHMLSLAGSRACGERLTQPERVSRTSLLSMTLAGRAAASAHAAARGSSPADTTCM